MDLTISPRVRVLALAGLVAALAFALGLFVLGRTQESSSAAPDVIKPASLVKKSAGAAPLPAKPAAKAARKPAAKPAPKPKPPAQPAVADNGLPFSIASALARHEVVVVSLYAPEAAVDQMALKEASAGASLAGAGFVAVNVLRQSQSRPLTALLGVLQDPAVLVFRRPGDLYLRINGFVDRETVAQAAANAAASA